MKDYLKKLLWLLFFVCIAITTYVNMDFEDIAPQSEEQEIKHVQM